MRGVFVYHRFGVHADEAENPFTVVVEKRADLRIGQSLELGPVNAWRLNEVFVRAGELGVGTQTITWD